jgi:hypothetical protein
MSTGPFDASTSEGDADATYEHRRASIFSTIPAWYRPGLHLAVPTVLGLGVMIAAAGRVHALRPLDLLAVPVVLLASFGFEWRVHKRVLHHRLPLLGTLYVRHELQHHVVFTFERMTMRAGREARLILMPAYAVVLVFALALPVALVAARFASENAALLGLATAMFFFLSYEWLHLAYHLPDGHPVRRLPLIDRLREHHRRHHDPRLMKRWNFNVTVPLFDWLYGTVWSKEREAAPRGRVRRWLSPRRVRS